MPIPLVDNNHVTEALGLLTSHYADKPVTTGLVKALTQRVQELENQIWSLINGIQLANHPMPGGPWSILDQLGTLVGIPRNGLPDSQYVGLIKLKAKVNTSRGLAADMIDIVNQLLGSNTAQYVEYYPAAFYLEGRDINPALPNAQLLSQARPGGVYGEFVYTIWPTGHDFKWVDVTSPSPEGGWGSTVGTPANQGLLVSAAVI